MAQLATNRSALHIVWLFPTQDATSVKALRARLAEGHESRLFELQEWGFRDGKASAILAPEAPLEDILELIWGHDQRPAAITVVPQPEAARGAGDLVACCSAASPSDAGRKPGAKAEAAEAPAPQKLATEQLRRRA